MTPYRQKFVNFREAVISVTLADSHQLQSEGYGDVFVTVDSEGRFPPFQLLLRQVWLVPGLSQNLISMHNLAKDGIKTIFNYYDATLNRGKAVAYGHYSQGQYWITTITNKLQLSAMMLNQAKVSDSKLVAAAAKKDTTISLEVAHRRA